MNSSVLRKNFVFMKILRFMKKRSFHENNRLYEKFVLFFEKKNLFVRDLVYKKIFIFTQVPFSEKVGIYKMKLSFYEKARFYENFMFMKISFRRKTSFL